MFPNEEAHANIVLEASESWQAQEAAVAGKVEETLAGEKVDAILCVAGGWAGGNAAHKGNIHYLKSSTLTIIPLIFIHLLVNTRREMRCQVV